MRYFQIIPSFFFLLLLVLSCSNNTTQESPEIALEYSKKLGPEFIDFYKKFHTDSSYQMEHIQWPLRGIPDRQIAEGEAFYFQPDSWRMQKTIDPSSGYVSEFMMITEALVQENIVNASDNTQLIRRFLRDKNGWRLIYYQGVRKRE